MRVRTNVCPMTGSPRRRGTKHFSYNFYICTNPFIHFLGFSLIKCTIVRLNGRAQQKQSLQVRLGGASLRLGGKVHLGEALLRLRGPENAKYPISSPPRHRGVRLNAKTAKFGPFHLKFPSKLQPTHPKNTFINHKTHLYPPKIFLIGFFFYYLDKVGFLY